MEKTREQKLDEVMGRAMRDMAFRQRLTSNPKAVAMEEGLGADELEVIAGGMSVGILPNLVAYCSDKICYEKGGVRQP